MHPIVGVHDDNTLAQLDDVAARAERVALMADGHLGYIMPVGGVAAYDNKVSVAGVGFDIACGNAAVRTDLNISQFDRRDLEEMADDIWSELEFGIGRSNRCNDAPVNHSLFEDARWNAVPARHRHNLREKARNQLGTIGSGNHYVDVFADRDDGTIWVGVHFGSRGFGHTVASNFMALSRGEKWGTRVRETEALFDLGTPLGDDYWSLMSLAGDYAYAGREWVVRKVVDQIGAVELELVHNHHNHAWRERHGGRELVVVRKGATPAFPGQKGFVGGSMGDVSVILQGRDTERAAELMYSTVHGAGRVMSRTAAAGKRNRKGKVLKPGRVSPSMMREWLERENVILRGGGLDESPHAYRRLPDVLEAQGDTIDVLHQLQPVVVCMAGAKEFDPYRD